MSNQLEKITLETLSAGAAIERLNIELEGVLENILDPNTSPKTLREINLKIKIKPHDDRASAYVEIQATKKLAPVTEHITQIYIGKDQHGRPEASEVIEQPTLPGMDNVTQLDRKDGTND